MENEKIILDRNENNYGPAPACYEILKNADLTQLSYYSKAYTKGVKSILSERIANDFGIEEERVIIGSGAEDLLKQTVQCYLNENEILMVPSHSWWYYQAIAEEVGGAHIEYPIIEEEDIFRYDVDKLIDLAKAHDPKIIFICSPNNPTGNSIELSDLERILELLKNQIIVLDEAYLYKTTDSVILNLLDRYPKFMIVRTFSKYYALAGSRIGYGLTGKGLTKLCKYANRYLGFNRLSEEMAIASLDSQEYFDDIASKYAEDRNMMYNELSKLKGFRPFRSNATFILVEIDRTYNQPLKDFLLKRNIHIKFMNEKLLNHHLRISLGTQEQNRIAIDAIKEFVNTYAETMVK